MKGNIPSARQSAVRLADRLLEAHSTLKPHLVMDSLFGSFEDINVYHLKGISLTVSMAEKQFGSYSVINVHWRLVVPRCFPWKHLGNIV